MPGSNPKWYAIEDTDLIDTPALLIYPQRVKENIRLLMQMIDDPKRLRPHIKTHKTKEATLLLLEAGITKFKCATIAEAEMLGMCKADDVLLAYQPVGPKLSRLIALIKDYTETYYSCLIDNITTAIHISEAAIANNLGMPVYIDLNIGMNRTGIAPEDAIELYEEVFCLNGIKVEGLHAYDGHIREDDFGKRTLACNKAYSAVENLCSVLVAKGYGAPKIIAGGSPTFPVHALRANVECSPGTFIFWDKGYEEGVPEQKFLPSAVVMTRIISMPGKTKLCLDLGHKSIAAENSLKNRVFFLNAPEVKIAGHSEEHMVIEVPDGHAWKIGDVLYGIPVHVCPTCALYESATIIEDGKVTGTWKIIARDKKISI